MKIEVFYSKNAKKNTDACRNCEPAKIITELYQRGGFQNWRPDRSISGDSYETGYDLMLDLARAGHGKGFAIVSGTMRQGQVVHCWLEHGDWVIDFSNGKQRIYGRKYYYEQAGIDRKHVKQLSASQFRRRVQKLAAEEEANLKRQISELTQTTGANGGQS